MPSEARQRAEEVIERAKQEVFAICKGRHHGGHEWRMSIPVNEERDSDRIIMAGLNAANDLLAAEVQRAGAGEREALKIEYNAMMVRYETQSAEQTKQIHEDATQIEKFKRHLEECHTRATAAELRGRALSEAIDKARRETASDPNNRWCRNATIILNVALTPEGSGAS